MEVSKETLLTIANNTQCPWTCGYIRCLLDIRTTSNVVVAKTLMDRHPENKIQAIKAIRARFGLGLKEAKEVVDIYWDSGRVVGIPDQPDDDTDGMAVGVN